ncbi:MAG: hypothetical protein LQ346_008340 [Caloplaca aetnensis]|nr:MAG: hypothetical protein LQ346_008340 [Caloplaca aetnensis]
MSNLNILVAGSGIAGGAFAFCLLRAYPDANITIIERDPALRLTGASVDIRTSAVDIIKWMGIEPTIREHTTNEKGVSFVDANGKAVATFEATGNTNSQSLTSEYEIFRGALAKILLDPVIDRVTTIFDETVDHYEQHDDGVVVTFAKSKEVKKYDLLVAADGLRSKIRGAMLNTKPEEHICGGSSHAAFFTIKKDLLQGGQLAKWYNAPMGRTIFLRPDPDPAGRTRGHFLTITTDKDLERRKRLDDALRQGNESYMKLMEELYEDAGWLAPEVLQAMRESDDFYCSLFAGVRSPKLQQGRVVLLGDAGYATPGIGTSLAIVGGYVLAGELLNHLGDVHAALKGYENIMIPHVNCLPGVETMDSGMQWMTPQTWWGISIRNVLLGVVTTLKLDKLGMLVASATGFAAEKKVAMPEYPWPVLNEAKAS